MADYLLDTNHISPLVTLGHPVRQRVLDGLDAGSLFYIATPALHEFKFGISLLPRAKQNKTLWLAVEDYFNYCAVDKIVAEQAANLRVALRKKGWQLGAVDAMIATIALQKNLILLTTDKDFQAVPELKYENWR